MKIRSIGFLVVLLAAAFLRGDTGVVSAETPKNRVRFQIATVAENHGERKMLAQTVIEGAPGTDFNIDLRAGSFKLLSRFLTDQMGDDKLKIRTQTETRRFYGYSPSKLPLYEEDDQKNVLEVRFNETIVLLPFGNNPDAETLKIEITPTLVPAGVAGAEDKLTINFEKQLSSGEINIEAFKIPHRFAIDAVLLADGQEVAKGSADALLEDGTEIIMRPVDGASSSEFVTRVTVDKFSRSRPIDLVGINFELYRKDSEPSLPVISNGAGVGAVGGEFKYDIRVGGGANLPDTRKYELKFKVRLAEN